MIIKECIKMFFQKAEKNPEEGTILIYPDRDKGRPIWQDQDGQHEFGIGFNTNEEKQIIIEKIIRNDEDVPVGLLADVLDTGRTGWNKAIDTGGVQLGSFLYRINKVGYLELISDYLMALSSQVIDLFILPTKYIPYKDSVIPISLKLIGGSDFIVGHLSIRKSDGQVTLTLPSSVNGDYFIFVNAQIPIS